MNTPGKKPAKAGSISQLKAAWPKRHLIIQQQFSRVKEMAGLEQTPANQDKRRQLSRVLNDDLGRALRRGFFGVVRVEVKVQDGTIQHIRHYVERIEK